MPKKMKKMKKMKKIKKISIKSIGNLIESKIDALKAARSDAPLKAQQHYDYHIKRLSGIRAQLMRDCKLIWEIPNPNI